MLYMKYNNCKVIIGSIFTLFKYKSMKCITPVMQRLALHTKNCNIVINCYYRDCIYVTTAALEPQS